MYTFVFVGVLQFGELVFAQFLYIFLHCNKHMHPMQATLHWHISLLAETWGGGGAGGRAVFGDLITENF